MLKDRADHSSNWKCNAGAITGKSLKVHAEAVLIEMRDPQTLRSLNATLNSREEEVTRCGHAVEFLLRQGTFGQHRPLTCRI